MLKEKINKWMGFEEKSSTTESDWTERKPINISGVKTVEEKVKFTQYGANLMSFISR